VPIAITLHLTDTFADRREGDGVRWPSVRNPSRQAALVVSALLMSACGPVEGPATAPERAPVQVDASLGVIRIPVGSPIPVGIVLDMGGEERDLGLVLEAAFQAATEDFGVVQQGFRVELRTRQDATCSRADGSRAGRELLEEAGADTVAVLGPQCAATLLGLQDALDATGLVIVTPRVQDLDVTGAAGTTWRTAPSLLDEALAAAVYSIEVLEHSRAVVLHTDDVESLSLAAAFRTRFESLGGTVVVTREVDAGLTSDDEARADQVLTSVLSEVAAGDAGTAFLVLPIDMLLALSDGWSGVARLGGMTRMTTSRAAVEEFLGDGSSLDHVLTGPVLLFPDAVSAVTGMSASQTLERVGAISGVSSPAGWWAYAYDAATLLLRAIEDASIIDVDGSLVLSRAELRQALARTSFRGLTGSVGCTAQGECASPLIAVRQHSDTADTDLTRIPVGAVIER
jgi:branched-chain amino acid transport system substrate-binding protein